MRQRATVFERQQEITQSRLPSITPNPLHSENAASAAMQRARVLNQRFRELSARRAAASHTAVLDKNKQEDGGKIVDSRGALMSL